MNGFFNVLEIQRKPIPLLPRCGACLLYKHCKSPKMPVSGKGKRKILIIGEGPGENEDNQNLQFVGVSGQFLQEATAKAGFDYREDAWITNAIICRAKGKDGGNRTPTDKEIGYCQPNLVKTIKELQPEIIIPLGASAVKSLLSWVWSGEIGALGRWVGWRIPCQKLNAWIAPTWHPAHLLRDPKNEVLKLLFEKHLRRTNKLRGRPWVEIPEWKNKVGIVFDGEEVGKIIHAMITFGKPTAIDYETDRLKPDHKDARIVSCAISNGIVTISFPWHGEARKAVKELLLSDVPKIGSNIKFEIRWSLKEFGFAGRNWAWDTMVAAHVLDCRPKITSIKFLAFVMLGQDVWNIGVKEYLEADGSNVSNRIKELDRSILLRYGGMDALLEHKVAMIQSRRLGVEL